MLVHISVCSCRHADVGRQTMGKSGNFPSWQLHDATLVIRANTYPKNVYS